MVRTLLFGIALVMVFFALNDSWLPSSDKQYELSVVKQKTLAEKKISLSHASASVVESPLGIKPGHPQINKKNDLDTEVIAAFSGWVQRYRDADPEQQKLLVDEGRSVALKRKPLMQSLIQTDPEQALRHAISYAEYDQLPPVVKTQVEIPFTQRANIRVMPDETRNGPEKETRFLYLNGVAFKSFVYGSRSALTSKHDLPVQGIQLEGSAAIYEYPLKQISKLDTEWVNTHLDKAILGYRDFLTGEVIPGEAVVAIAGGRYFYFANEANLNELNQQLVKLEQHAGPKSGSQLLFLESGASSDSTQAFNLTQATAMAQQLASSWTETSKKVFFIQADFLDKPGLSMSKADLQEQLANEASSRILEFSYGKTWIEPEVSSVVVRLPKLGSYYGPASGIDRSTELYDDALAAFNGLNTGIDLNSYDIIGVQFNDIGFGWGGRASIGGSMQLLQGSPSTETIVHELGHNYGLWHASFWDAGDIHSIGAGVSQEYGDYFDVMGSDYSGNGHFHMQAKSRLNWLDSTQWQDINVSGTYRINRFDHQQSLGKQGLRIAIGPDEYYWLGYRKGFTDNVWLQNGIYLLWQRAGETKSWLIDSTPGSVSGKDDAAVLMGRTYVDEAAGIYITPTLSGGEGAAQWIDIQVNIGNFSANQSPVANITGVTQAKARTAYTFTADASDPEGDSLTYLWDFGDGVTHKSTSTITHIWAVGGHYEVKLMVNDGKGGVANTSIVLDVADPATQWSSRVSGIDEDLVAVAEGGGYLLTASTRGQILKSIDGITWTSVASAIGFRSYPSGMVADNFYSSDLLFVENQWLLTGKDYDFDINAWVGVIFTSPDGVQWTRRYHGGAGTNLNGIAGGIVSNGQVLVAVGDNGTILRSTDGLNWLKHNPISSSSLSSISYANGVFFAVGNAHLLRSIDSGFYWTDLANNAGVEPWSDLDHVSTLSDHILVTGWEYGLGWSGDTGVTFGSKKELLTAGAGLAFGKGLYFVAGKKNDLDVDLFSYNGDSWLSVNDAALADRNDVVFFDDTFITVGDSGDIRQSAKLLALADSDNDGIADVYDPTPINTFIDTDGDGIDDATEIANGLNKDINDANGDIDNDGLTNLAEYQQGTGINNADSDNDGLPDGYDSKPLNDQYLGHGQVNARVNQNWKAINFPSQFTQPVIIAGPPSYNGADPGVVRIKNINSSGFEAKFQLHFQEWDYRAAQGDTSHGEETIPHLILEKGRHLMSDGSIWEVGTFDINGTGTFAWQSFSEKFAAAPKLFLTLQTSNGGQAVTARVKKVYAGGFNAALFEEQGLMDGHASETVGYLAIYSPKGSGHTYVGGKAQPYTLQQVPVGSDWRPILHSALLVEEEKSKDAEIAHMDENIDVLTLGTQLFAQDVSTLGTDTAALRQNAQPTWGKLAWGVVEGITDQWTVVPLNKTYSAPVVVASLGERKGELGVVQVRNVTTDSFEVRYREWDYLDKTHTVGEQIFYLIAEAGEHTVAGFEIKAGTHTLNKMAPQADVINYNTAFSSWPALFTGMMTTNGWQVAVPRVITRNTTQFQLGLQEQESLSDGHGNETVGWIAIQAGKGKLNGRRFEVTNRQVDDQGTQFDFTQTLRRRFPVVIQSLISHNSGETAIAEQTGLTAKKVHLRLQEEQSQDDETVHVKETIGVFVAE